MKNFTVSRKATSASSNECKMSAIAQSILAKSRFLCFFSLIVMVILCSHSAKALKGNTNSHDPSALMKDGNKYWQFTTGNGIYAAYSYDLISWTAGPQTVFPIGTWPSWINSAVPGFEGHFWAPDVIYMNGLYHLYYSVSTFGSSRSAIGLVTNPTLDPNNPNYKWTDRGMVVSSDGSSTAYNAIDPALIRDSDGSVYMSYGSFFGGLVVVEIDPSTGKLRSGTPFSKVAGGNHADWEAPYIVKEGNYYYFFANRGKCCQGVNSTYTIVMGRSTNIWGPYYDQNGVNLNNGGGTLVLGSSGRYHGPGHVGLLRENGTNFVSIHYYDQEDNGNAKLDIINLGFYNGWPFLTRDWLASGQYKVTNKRSGKVWDAWGCTGELGQAIAQGDWYNLDCQKWNFTPLGDGIYKVANQLGGRVADVYGCNPDNGAKLNLWDWLNNDCQKFEIERAADGSHVFTSLTGNRVVEIPGGSTTAGVQLALWDYNGRDHQKWWAERLGNAPRTASVAEKTEAEVLNPAEEQESAFSIFPNPSEGGNFELNLGTQFDKRAVEVSVIDAHGRQVYSCTVSGAKHYTINAHLKPGIYVLLVRNGEETRESKLVVK